MAKRMNVIKKENDDIFISEESTQSVFYKKYRKYVVMLACLLLLFIGGIIIFSLRKSDDYVLKNPGVTIIFPDGDDIVIGDNDGNNSNGNTGGGNVITAKPEDVFNKFLNLPDEVCFKVKTIKLENMTIVFYSDNTAKIIDNENKIYRVLPVNGKYGVDEKGIIDKNAEKFRVNIIKQEKVGNRLITYYSDHSVEIEENGVDIWVGKEEEVKKNYITDNKLAYSNNVEEHDKFSVKYYDDGTIVIEENGKKYVVRDKNDVIINDNGYLFNNKNEATVTEVKVLDNGFTIYYLTDGGAIIEGNGKDISIRKSNSINIVDNKLINIKSSNIIEEASTKTIGNKEIVYYDNGIAIVKENDKVIGYVENNSDIKYTDNNILNIDDIVPLVSTLTPNDDTLIYIFDDDKIVIIGDNTIYDDKGDLVIKDGVVTIIDSSEEDINVSKIDINNTTENKVKIRIVIERGSRTTLQNEYLSEIKYRVSATKDINSINNKVWEGKDNEFILYEDELDSNEEKKYELGIWLDYTKLRNDAMDKYFYGTLKVYSWEQK